MKGDLLASHQIAFLEKLGENESIRKHFYLTGGTALSVFYLQHRHSEDLDFFSEKEFEVLGLSVFFKKIKKELGISKIDYEQSFHRNLFFLYFGKRVLKTEFTFFPFPRIERGLRAYGLEIDSLTDIAVNKLFSIYQRAYARDYIDLYFICREKKITVPELVKKARIKFDWHIDFLQLGSQFIKAKEVGDYPRMIKRARVSDWQDFFIAEAKNFKKKILM